MIKEIIVLKMPANIYKKIDTFWREGNIFEYGFNLPKGQYFKRLSFPANKRNEKTFEDIFELAEQGRKMEIEFTRQEDWKSARLEGKVYVDDKIYDFMQWSTKIPFLDFFWNKSDIKKIID